MTLKYKQAVLIQNRIDGNSVPVGQPELASVRATTEMLVAKKSRVTLTNTVVTVPIGGDTSVQLLELPDRNIQLLGINLNLTVVKGNTVDGIVAATPITVGVGKTAGSDNLINGFQNATESLTLTFQKHSHENSPKTIAFPYIEPQTSMWLYVATDTTPTVEDTVTINGTIDFFYFDLSKPGL